MPLDRYQRKIEKLATQWPTAWHFVCLAEDRCSSTLDLLADEPFSSDFTAALNGHFDGFHSGFPYSSFNGARFLPGGPPPVRNCQHLRGYPSNSRVRQLEAEKGTRSAAMVRAAQLGRKKLGLRCTATLENPADPGVDPYPSAWLLPALASQHHYGTQFTAFVVLVLLIGRSIVGLVSFQPSKHSKRSVVARFRRCPCLPKQPLESRRRSHHSSA